MPSLNQVDIVLKTLDGEQTIQIHAGIQNGNTVRIKNAGVPIISRPSQRGDHIVVVSIKIPKQLSDEQRELYKKLYELDGGKKPSESLLSKVKGVFQ